MTTTHAPEHSENLYSVYDSKVQAYLPPFTAVNDGVAIRHFSGSLRQNGIIQTHPEDFALWRIGTWKPADADINASHCECIAKAHELMAKLQAEMQNSLFTQEQK